MSGAAHSGQTRHIGKEDAAARTTRRTAWVVIAHGSRRPEANDELRHVVRRLQQQTEALVTEAFLELAEPSIPQALEHCVAQGAAEVRLLPYFLSFGRHVVDDLEAFRAEFQQRFPQTAFTLSPPLGVHDKIVEVLLERAAQDLADHAPGTG